MVLEICAPNLASALAAQSAGAHRIELCCALESGGLTPSAGAIREAVRQLSIPVMVLIRPREGDFCYSQSEAVQMCADIRFCREAGAQGVVIGALTPDNRIDLPVLDTLLEAVEGMETAFHRAFDFVADPEAALETLIGRSVKRVLSSGRAPGAWEGRARLRAWVEQSAGRIAIMPGAGINAGNIHALAEATGAAEFHCSAKRRVEQPGRELSGLERGYWVSGEADIRAVLKELKR